MTYHVCLTLTAAAVFVLFVYPSTSSRANVHFSDNLLASGLYNSIQHTTEVVYSQSTVQYSTVQYSTAQYSTVQYSIAQHSTVQYSTAKHITVQYSTAQYSTVQYIIAQHSTVQYSTAQYITVQYSTAQHSHHHHHHHHSCLTAVSTPISYVASARILIHRLVLAVHSMQFSMVYYKTVQYQYSTVHFNTAQHSTPHTTALYSALRNS